jgi:predicted transcriptional regulator of viral defense system
MSDSARVAAPRELPDWLLSHGKPWVTNEEIASLLAVSRQEASKIAGRWHAKSLAFSSARGLQMLIPPEFRSWAAVPASHFVDPMMKHLGHDYYVGYLSAAEVHGAAHQRPQVFQVVTNRRTRDRDFGRVRVEFISSAETATRPTTVVNTATGTMVVSSVDTTVLDLVAHPLRGAGISNVATIIAEFIEAAKIDTQSLAVLSADYPSAVTQRLGWLIDFVSEHLGVRIDTDTRIARVGGRIEPAPLIASRSRHGRRDQRWNVYVNGEVEVDV